MKSHRISKIVNKVWARVQLTFSLPTVWVSILILVAAIVSIILSKWLYDTKRDFVSSIFSNIFAGLITGFALSILSGTKAVYSAYMEERYSFLEETHTMILDLINMHHELLSSSKIPNDEFSDKAYDTGACASWINQRVMQKTFDKGKWIDPPKYFLKKYGYDCFEMSKVLSEFRDSLFLVGMDMTTRKADIELFRPIVRCMMDLNNKILADMRSIKIKIASARKSII